MKWPTSTRNVVAPLGQRGHAHRHHVQAVIEIFAEAAGFDLGAQIARGGGDHARIDLHARLAADAGEGLVDQHAQDLALRLQRHVGDFVEIERAVMREFEQAGLARAVAAFHAEQFGLDAGPAPSWRS